MSQQQTRCSEIPIVTNSQSHKTDFFPPCCPVSSEQRELRVKSSPLWGWGAANAEPFWIIIHMMFCSRVVRLSNVFTMERSSNSIPLDRPECLKCFDCKYRRETRCPEQASLKSSYGLICCVA